jgi:hypothetical protein
MQAEAISKNWEKKSDEEIEKKTALAFRNRKLALKDFSDALLINPEKNVEKAARLGRLRLWIYIQNTNYSLDEYYNDFDWLKNNTQGYELGEVYFTWINYSDYLAVHSFEEGGAEIVQLLSEAIDLGYETPKVYYLRSIGHKAEGNNGIALRDIDIAIEKYQGNDDEKVEYLCLRAEVLAELKKYNEAYETLSTAEKIDRKAVKMHLMITYFHSFIDILCLFGLEQRYKVRLNEPELRVLQYLLLWSGRTAEKYKTNKNGDFVEIKSILDNLLERYPGVIEPLKALVDEKTWMEVGNGDKRLRISFDIPTFQEQINSKTNIVVNIGDIEDD